MGNYLCGFVVSFYVNIAVEYSWKSCKFLKENINAITTETVVFETAQDFI